MKTKKYIKGMALLETLVAMLVFALLVIHLVRLQVMSMEATKAGFYKTETAAAAESMMDYLKTDIKNIFDGKWQKVAVVSGEDCQQAANEQAKIACQMLNKNDGQLQADGNAVLCVFGERPTYPSGPLQKNRDQYLISIRAIWYSGKRQDKSDFYNKELEAKDCGLGYQDPMSSGVIDKENIDSLQIDMAY